jgi:hypothetical protein
MPSNLPVAVPLQTWQFQPPTNSSADRYAAPRVSLRHCLLTAPSCMCVHSVKLIGELYQSYKAMAATIKACTNYEQKATYLQLPLVIGGHISGQHLPRARLIICIH